MDILGMNLSDNNILFKKRIRVTSNGIIGVERFNIDKDLRYLNLKLSSCPQMNLSIFLLLIDSNNILRLQYLNTNSKNNLVIGENANECSIGAYPGVICKGEWKLVIINLQNERQNVDYIINIKGKNKLLHKNIDKLGEEIWVDYNKETSLLSLNNYDWNKSYCDKSKWYKGDFHTHTILSDGKMTDEVYINTAKEMKMDFAVSTEHNIIPTGWKKDKEILIIPGTEITLKDGHFNILGVRKSPLQLKLIENIKKQVKENLVKESNEEEIIHEIQEDIVREILYNYNDTKSIYSINHMMLEFWKWKFLNIQLDKFNSIEICNDPTYYLGPKSNDQVIRLFDILWNDGYRIYGIGGSDAHILPTETYDNSNERSIIGDPGTFVYCDKLTSNNIIEAVKKGHVYVSRGLTLDIAIDAISNKKKKSYFPGDKIEIYDIAIINYTINICLENIVGVFGDINKINTPLKVYIIENGQIIQEIVSYYGNINFTVKWNKDEFKYLRVEIRELNGKFRGFINPIYHGYKEHKLITFKHLFEKYNNEVAAI